MRLPPPPRRYSPISVMASTPETVSRPNSRSMAARSSRSSSKNSFPLMVAGVLKADVPDPVVFSPRRHGVTEKIRESEFPKPAAVQLRRLGFYKSHFSVPLVSPW